MEMALNHKNLSRRKLNASIAAGVAAIALATGGYAIANSGSSGTNTATATVIPFERGNPSPATPVGHIPANFTDGSGTIVTGTAANKAKAAASSAYPGGIVNRVAKLSNGEYNVHMIAVNWPHHVFVNRSFEVVGAE
jgi:hypothetical protein